MTLLQLVQAFSRRQGIKVPSAVVANTDETVLQVWGLLDEVVTTTADRAEWHWLRQRARFNHANQTDYLAYDLDSLNGYKGAVPGTLWCESLRLPVAGPVSPAVWQQMILMSTPPAQYTYRQMSGGLYIYPVPTDLAGTFFNLEYVSRFPVAGSGGTAKELFTADDDTSIIPDRIILAGLRWRWKKEKNQAYAEELRDYESMLSNEQGRETIPQDVRLDNPDPDSRVAGPGLLIAAGSWNVP